MKMKLTTRKILSCLLIVLLLVCVGCQSKKERIQELIDNAKKAEQHGDFEDARNYYAQAAEIDADNIDVKYGLEDLETHAAQLDSSKLADIHSAIVNAIYDPSVTQSESYVKPVLGRYQLDSFLDKRGSDFKKYVCSALGVNDINEVSAKFVSINIMGTPLANDKVYIDIYDINSSSVTISVYCQRSKDPKTGEPIYGGVKYNPSFNFDEAVGINEEKYTHTTFLDLIYLPSTGDIIEPVDDLIDISKNPRNEAKKFTIMSYNPPEFNANVIPAQMSGCIIKDEFDTYYVVRGRITSWGSRNPDIAVIELMEISKDKAMKNLDWQNSYLMYDEVIPGPYS